MENKTKAKWKDEILNYLEEEYPRAIDVMDIGRVVTQGVLKADQIVELCEEIITDSLEILEKEPNSYRPSYKATDKTLGFLLKLGGYTKHQSEKDNLEFQEKLKEYQRKEVQDEIVALQRKNLQLRTKTHWIPIIVSILGFIIALASYFKPSIEVLEPVYDTRLRNIEMKIEQLEQGLKKDLDSLQNELYEAQRLIDSLAPQSLPTLRQQG